jgi:methyl-accepting chemotaxis protein
MSIDTSQIKKKASIKSRLLSAFLLLSLIPLLASVAISYFLSQNTIQSITTNNLESTGKVQVTALVSWIDTIRYDDSALAQISNIQSMDPALAQPTVLALIKEWKNYEGMFVAGPDKVTIASEDSKSHDLTARAYMTDVLNGKAVLSDPVVSKASGNVVVVAAAPIYKDGKVVGAAGLTTATSKINEILKSAQLGETGEAYLITSDGTFITPSKNEEILKADKRITNRSELELKIDTEASRAIKAGKSGSGIYKGYMGKEVIGAYQYIPELGWGLIVEQDTSEALAYISQLRIIFAALFVFSAIVVIVIALLLARNISDPIKKMAAIAHGLARGDINQQVHHTTSDEIGELAGSFQTMISYQQEMASTAGKIADGDLSIQVKPLSGEDVLGNAFLRMVNNLRKTILNVSDNTVSLDTASKQLAQASHQANIATSQIATTIQQVAAGTTQQTDSTTRTAAAVEQMSRAIDGVAKGAQEQATAVTKMAGISTQISAAIEMVSTNAKDVTTGAKDASTTALKGADIVSATVNGMSSIQKKVNLSASKVEEMGSRSDQIGAIVATIEDIASQTNLLALNAAIEAARAGEHGKGFAVVADEVRKLAEKSSIATKEIGGLIKGIQQTVSEAVIAMHESATEVETGTKLANDAGDALKDILKSADAVQQLAVRVTQASVQMQDLSNELITAADEVSAIVEENTAATEEMAAGSSEITRAIENIASVSEENSASVEEVSASAEEMSAQVQEVSTYADSLRKMADELAKIVAEFKLK